MIADFLHAFHSLRSMYHQSVFSKQVFMDNQITQFMDGCSVLPGILLKEITLSMHLSFDVAEKGSLNWVLNIRSLQDQETKGQYLLAAYCSANYGDEPYQTMVEDIASAEAKNDEELIHLTEQFAQKIIDHLREQIQNIRLPEMIEVGKTRPFYSGL